MTATTNISTTRTTLFKENHRSKANGIAIACLLFWSLIVVVFDCGLLWSIGRTAISWSYPSAEGTIVQSEVIEDRDSDGDPRFQAKVKYRYHVGGRDLTGERLTFLNMTSNHSKFAKECVARWPIGQSVPVHYRPSDPMDSVLDRSVTGEPFFVALFLLPFNAVMWAGWWWLIGNSRGGREPLQRVGQEWRLSRSSGNPMAVALIVASTISFGATFVVGMNGWIHSLTVMLPVWFSILSASTVAAWHTRATMADEPPALILHDETRRLTWPAFKGSAEFSVVANQLRSVEIDEAERLHPNRDNVIDYLVQLTFCDENNQHSKRLVQKTTSARQALLLSEWLEEWAGLRQQESPPSS